MLCLHTGAPSVWTVSEVMHLYCDPNYRFKKFKSSTGNDPVTQKLTMSFQPMHTPPQLWLTLRFWGCIAWRCSVSLTSPARLGLPLIEEVAELSELMEEALGLLFRVEILRELLALVGVVHGKPIRVTLWTGANRPYLGRHWKYLRRRTGGTNWNLSWPADSWFKIYLYDWCCYNRFVSVHLVPATAPSFFPRGSSSSTPHHSPLAKSVSPRNRTTPAFVPPTCTQTKQTIKTRIALCRAYTSAKALWFSQAFSSIKAAIRKNWHLWSHPNK